MNISLKTGINFGSSKSSLLTAQNQVKTNQQIKDLVERFSEVTYEVCQLSNVHTWRILKYSHYSYVIYDTRSLRIVEKYLNLKCTQNIKVE